VQEWLTTSEALNKAQLNHLISKTVNRIFKTSIWLWRGSSFSVCSDTLFHRSGKWGTYQREKPSFGGAYSGFIWIWRNLGLDAPQKCNQYEDNTIFCKFILCILLWLMTDMPLKFPAMLYRKERHHSFFHSLGNLPPYCQSFWFPFCALKVMSLSLSLCPVTTHLPKLEVRIPPPDRPRIHRAWLAVLYSTEAHPALELGVYTTEGGTHCAWRAPGIVHLLRTPLDVSRWKGGGEMGSQDERSLKSHLRSTFRYAKG